MPDKFDPYRDALVVETMTIWPPELSAPQPAARPELEKRLHAEPDKAAELEYVRLHAGFCRKITVTPADLERLAH
jgi:hypothetical protein